MSRIYLFSDSFLSSKLFPSGGRATQDSYGQYPWTRDEHTQRFPSDKRSHAKNTASEFEIEQSIRDREMKRNLLQELLDLVRK